MQAVKVDDRGSVDGQCAAIAGVQCERIQSGARGGEVTGVIEAVIDAPQPWRRIRETDRSLAGGCECGEIRQCRPSAGSGFVILIGQARDRSRDRGRRTGGGRGRGDEDRREAVIEDVRDGQPDVRRADAGDAQQLLPRLRIVVGERDRSRPGIARVVEHFDLVGQLRRTGQRQLPLHEQLAAKHTGRRTAHDDGIKGGCRGLVGQCDRVRVVIQTAETRAAVGFREAGRISGVRGRIRVPA